MQGNPEEWIARLLIGDLSSSEKEHLADLLRSDPDLRSIYQQQVLFDSLLAWHHGSAGQVASSRINPIVIAELLHDAEVAARRQLEEELKERARIVVEEAARQREVERLQRRHVRRPEPIVIPYSVVYLGAAGLAASLIWMAYTLVPWGYSQAIPDNRSVVQVAQPLPIVATIVDSVEAELAIARGETDTGSQWQALGVAGGTQLSEGMYKLGHGVVEIEFESGAIAVLEAPAAIELVSASHVRLARGRIVGRVPRRAIGFAVETPSATIVDLGTEFGIAVPDTEEGHAADVMVFDGEVEVFAAAEGGRQAGKESADSQKLTMDASVRVNGAGSFVESETTSQLYFRKVPTSRELAQKMAYERWLAYSKKMAADPDVVAYYTFNDQQPEDSHLLNRAGDRQSLHGEIRGAQWSEGRWHYKQALRFANGDPYENPSNYVEVNIPGKYDAATLASWICIDAIPVHHDKLSGLLMTDGWNRPGQLHWQLQGDGRLQAGAYLGSGNPASYEVNSDDTILLHDFGNWHHVALVYSSQAGKMTFYLDGRPVGARDIPAHDGILFGATRIGGWKPDSNDNRGYPPDDFRTLHGRMDELLVLGRAMSDAEMEQLYEAGRP